MKYVSASELEANLFRLIGEVARGETIVVTDNETGGPIAEIQPVKEKSGSSIEETTGG